MMKYKNILITGGAGFIGSNLALKLLEQGCKVTVMDNLSQQVHGIEPGRTSPLFRSIKDKVRFVQADVRNDQAWMECLKDVEVVVHFAAETGTGQSMYQVNHYVDVNIGGTALMLDLITNQKTSVQKIVVASSRSIYGEGKYFSPTHGDLYPKERRPENMKKGDFEVRMSGSDESLQLCATDEVSAIHPSSIYGITKQTQEQLVLTAAGAIGIPAVAFRYQNVYGPGQSLSNPYTGILSIFSTQIKNNQGINIFEDGKESRDFVYIDDVVDATILGINSDLQTQEAYNVGSGIATTVIEVAEALMEHYQQQVPVTVTGNFRVGDIRHNYADLAKVSSQLGFTAKFPFSEGIRRFCEWVNQQETQVSRYEDSLMEMKEKGLLK